MKKINRRNFAKIIGSAGLASSLGMPSLVFGASKKVVVVGGGFGGATAAKYLRNWIQVLMSHSSNQIQPITHAPLVTPFWGV